MENTELKNLLESYNQDPKLKDLFNRSYGSSQDITTAIEVVERYKANIIGSKVEPKESLVKKIIKEPIEAFTRTALRTGQAIGGVISQAAIDAMPDSDPRKAEYQANLDKQLTSPTAVPVYSDVFGEIEPQKAFGQGGGMQIAGEALEIASYLPFTRMAGGVLAATRGSAFSNVAKTIARESAMGTGAFTLGEQLQEGEVNPAELAKNIVLGYIGGYGLGAGGNVLVRGARATRKGATTAGKRLKEVVKQTSEVTGGVSSNVQRNIRNISQEIAEEQAIRTRLATQPKAIKVFEETGSDNFIKAIENTASDLDLKAKGKILEKAEQRILGTAGDDLPRIVIAEEYIAPRVKAIQNRASEVGAKIGSYAEKTDIVKTDAILDTIVQEADKAGVTIKFNNKTKQFTITPKAGIAGVDTQKINTFENILKGFAKNEDRTIGQLHASRKNLSDLTRRTDSAQELFSPGGAVDNIRRKISETIGEEYSSLTREYSDLVRTLKDVDPKFNQRLDDEVLQELKNLKNSEIARRVLSNASANTRAMLESLDSLYNKEMLRVGKTVEKQNLLDLVDFAGAIEEGFGIAPRNSLFGQTAGAGANALLNVPQGVQHAVFKLFSKPTLNKQEAIKAMREYLEEYITKKGVITPSQVIKEVSESVNQNISDDLINEAKNKSLEEFVKAQAKDFHGTNVRFDKFEKSKLGVSTKARSAEKGFWFTDNKDVAKGYGEYASEKQVRDILDQIPIEERKGNWSKAEELTRRAEELSAEYADPIIIESKLNLKNPTVYDAKGAGFLATDKKINDLIDKAIKDGNDALIVKNLRDSVYYSDIPVTHTIVFDENKILTKSQLTDIWKKANNL